MLDQVRYSRPVAYSLSGGLDNNILTLQVFAPRRMSDVVRSCISVAKKHIQQDLPAPPNCIVAGPVGTL